MGDEHSNETTVSAKAARELIAGGKARVLDIRSDDDWNTVGNIPGSVRGSGDDAAQAATQIDDDKRVIVVCADGERSAEVAEKLRDEGRDAASIDGGMASWEDKGLALQPTDDPQLPGEGDDSDADADADADSPAEPGAENS